MSLEKLFLSKITVNVSRFSGYVYTAKISKTIVIKIDRRLREFFKPIKGSKPKLIHITPFYFKTDSDRTVCLYSYIKCRSRNIVKCEGYPQIVQLDGRYYFFFGFHTSIVKPEDFLNKAIQYGNDCFEFMSQKLCVEIESIEIIDAYKLGVEVAEKILDDKGLKIVFSSPTILRDPLRSVNKYKSFIPTPFNVFATPVYIMLINKGLYTKRRLLTELSKLHKLFNETYSVLGGVKIKFIQYGEKPEPVLIGYVNYRINEDYLKFLNNRLNIVEWLGEIFSYTIALGVGTGRASGFGHVNLKPIKTILDRRNQAISSENNSLQEINE
ncbi:MAG: CRISPR system precrRNA processing endoribonuclease RAMP protein Cas6 [Desulfurococcaceae archaeon]